MDLLGSETEKSEKIRQVEGFLLEMSGRFNPHIEVSPQIVTVNCCKPSPSEVKSFKELVGYIRGTQMEVSIGILITLFFFALTLCYSLFFFLIISHLYFLFL